MKAEQEAFAKAVGVLRPYLDSLVVVGGWAHRLFRLRPGATLPAFLPLMTDDADIAAPLTLVQATKPINILFEEAGFREELDGDERPLEATYVLKGSSLDFELEFNANRQGARTRRDGTRSVTAEIAGVVAQKLRWVDTLLAAPWTVTLDETDGYPVPGGAAAVQIANGASYLFQKLMVLPTRVANGWGPKDMLYMFDTLQLFADSLEELRACWKLLAPTVPARARADFD